MAKFETLESRSVWDMVFLFQGFLICLGNLLSIAVFWRRRYSLKRTSYLLINLSVADLRLGVCTIVYTIAVFLWPRSRKEPSTRVPFVLFVFASLYSVTLVSMDTAYAIVLPFRHRTTGRRAYCYAVTLMWLMVVLPSMHWFPFRHKHAYSVISSIVVLISGLCLIVIATSYSLIWCSVSNRSTRQTREQERKKKLALTLFLVTVLSLVTWIPGQLAFLSYLVAALHPARYVLRAFLMSNSFLNPVVYTFRLPEFRSEIKLMIRKLACFKSAGAITIPPLPAHNRAPPAEMQVLEVLGS